MFDADGNRYIDYVLSWGPMLLGHNHPQVMQAISQQLEKATSFGTPTELEMKLVDKIDYMPVRRCVWSTQVQKRL